MENIAADVWGIVGNVFAFLIIVAVLVAFALRAGKAALITLILSLYIGYAVFSVFPFTDMIASGSAKTTVSALVYLGIVAAAYLLIRRLGHASLGGMRILPLVVLCALSGGFLMALGYRLFDIDTAYNLPKTLDLLFAPKEYFFWWFIAPLAGVFVFAR